MKERISTRLQRIATRGNGGEHLHLEVLDGLRDALLQQRAEVLQLGARLLLQLLGNLHAPGQRTTHMLLRMQWCLTNSTHLSDSCTTPTLADSAAKLAVTLPMQASAPSKGASGSLAAATVSNVFICAHCARSQQLVKSSPQQGGSMDTPL